MPITNPTPRARFQTSAKTISDHRELMQKDEFDRSCDFAVLEYQRLLSQSPTSFNDAAANHFKMTGALEFLQTLRNLAEPNALPSPVRDANLSGNK